MTDDPITAALQQLAEHHDQLTQLTELITAIGDTLRTRGCPDQACGDPALRRRC
jgi:hypothetical protein